MNWRLVEQSELLSGETPIMNKNANAIPYPNQYLVTIGGRLHLTTSRLIFKSHSINDLTGKFSILLPTITEVKDTSGMLRKKIMVSTQTQNFEFIVWGIPPFLAAIDSARRNITPDLGAFILNEAASNLEKCGHGLQ